MTDFEKMVWITSGVLLVGALVVMLTAGHPGMVIVQRLAFSVCCIAAFLWVFRLFGGRG